jgi:putative hemolysin
MALGVIDGTSDIVSPLDRGAAMTSKRDVAVLGRIGSLETRLAISKQEIEAAQAIRYRVFVEEMGAELPAEAMRARRDFDAFDDICDHLIVLDTSIEGDSVEQIVATYRILRQDVADRHSGFYSASEFDVDALIARHPGKRFMELGRSCVLPPYRTKRTVELLWQEDVEGLQPEHFCFSRAAAMPASTVG